jgi:UDP-3-O-[3-hydroxymyristoyl] glucosamine N-acyltransferase
MKSTVKEIAEGVKARLVGDGTVALSGIASIESACAGDLVFVENEKHLRQALESAASAVMAGEFAAGQAASKPLLICSQPRLAFARAAKVLCAGSLGEAGVHPSAVVHPSARLGKEVRVEASVVIAEGAAIGDRTRVSAGTVIGFDVSIGNDCYLYPNVTIYAGARIGARVIIHAGAVLGSDGFGYVRDRATERYEKFPQVGRLEIGDTTVDRGALDVTRIGRGTKLDNLVHIGHNCQLGENVIIAAQTGLSGSIVLEDNVVLGGQVGIGEHARIEEGVMLGGQGGVLPHKVLRGKGVAFWGTPAKPVREYLRELAALARLARKG